jgi:FkbM family methyltransferase
MEAPMNELQRTLMTVSCRDSDVIPKVANAGAMVLRGEERLQLMHNGLEVVYGGYYGDWMAQVIRGLNGHHEPQEELVFHTLLRYIRHRTQIVELGCFWAYYSLWYLKTIPDSTALGIEPDATHLGIGMHNAALNGMSERMRFMNAWVGGRSLAAHAAPTETSAEAHPLPMVNAPAVLDHAGPAGIELLHLDIQGAELELLRSIDAGLARRLRFVMVSTHHSSISGSSTIHGDCVETLRALGATILVEHDVVESFSGDGLILASMLPEDRGLWFPHISRNRAETSMFKQA